MTWFKSPGHYPPSIEVGSQRFFLTEPDYLEVPDVRRLADVRRHAETKDGIKVIMIGVHPGGRNYPTLGRVWPRTKVGAIRGGDKQDQFHRLLAHHGFAWGGVPGGPRTRPPVGRPRRVRQPLAAGRGAKQGGQ
jgi:hypothetical protein